MVAEYPQTDLIAIKSGRRDGRRDPIITHKKPQKNLSGFHVKSFKSIAVTSLNPDGAKRTRTADPLHAMKGQNWLSPITITLVRDYN